MKKPSVTGPSPAHFYVRLLAGCCVFSIIPLALSKEPPDKKKIAAKPVATSPAKPVAEQRSFPVPTPEQAREKGLEYLLKQQHENGGWGQGGGWRQDLEKSGSRVEGRDVTDPPDLGNTCISLMALLRDGHTPRDGDHRDAAVRGFNYVCTQVEQSDADSLFVTPVRDTQLQIKIGPYVDTFLTAWLLSELKDDVPDDMEKRRAEALDKTIKKIEKHQKDDGTFAGNKGWASVLSQGLCSKAINVAVQNGAAVAQSTLEKDQNHNLAGLDVKTGAFSGAGSLTGSMAAEGTLTISGGTLTAAPAASAPSDAGISLYRESSKLNGLLEKTRSNGLLRMKSEAVIADASTGEKEKEQARADLKKVAADDEAKIAAVNGVAGKLGDGSFVAGFGNNGGEEFLSYMNISEAMHEKGGKDWDEWQEKMTKTLCSAQNEDGSWAGHHCITGRTFCTSSALLTLLVHKLPTKPALAQEDNATKPESEAVPVKASTEP